MKLETKECKGLKRMLKVIALKYGNLSHVFFFKLYNTKREWEIEVQIYKNKNKFLKEISIKTESEIKE